VAAKVAGLKAAERRIADAVTEEVYKRISRYFGKNLRKGVGVESAGSEPMRAKAIATAIEVFGSRQVVIRWFQRPNPALKMKTPSDAIASARGRKQVDAILGRIEHGVIS
jgi:Protein of unknown function (DUF2384)